MQTKRLAFAAGILFAACGSTYAQSNASILQFRDENDTATIEQGRVPAGSVLDASITQSRSSDNSATIRQRAGGSSSPVQASALVDMTGPTRNHAHVLQSGTTGGTTAELYLQHGNGSRAEVRQVDVSDSTAFLLQAGLNAGDARIVQGDGSASAHAETRQGAGRASTVYIGQGDQGLGGVTNTQARIDQEGHGDSAKVVQNSVDSSSGYISQGASPMPGYYYSSRGWVEVDRSLAVAPAAGSSAEITQQFGSNLTGYILQYGSGHIATVFQSGRDNTGGIVQTGYRNTAGVTQSGSFNTAFIAQSGNGATASLFQNGSGNTATIRQR